MDRAPQPAQGRPAAERDESPAERADRNWSEILQELRVSQTGTQIIGGFLLTLPFQARFADLDPFQVGLYVVLVALAAVSTALGLAVVRLHRARFRQHLKPELVELASRLLSVSVVAVATLSAGVVTLIVDVVLGRAAAAWAAAAAGAALVGLLVVLPRAAVTPATGRRRRQSPSTPGDGPSSGPGGAAVSGDAGRR